MRLRTGFTLIELLIVIAVMGIFAATQFVLMIEGVRRHDLVSKQAVLQGEARNILSAVGRDVRAAVDFPQQLGEQKAGPDSLLMVIADGEGGRRAVRYSLSPGDVIRAGREGKEAYLRKQVLIREMWSSAAGEGPMERRVVARDTEAFRWELLAGYAHPVISCSVTTAEVSNGRRVRTLLASLFTARTAVAEGGAEE